MYHECIFPVLDIHFNEMHPIPAAKKSDGISNGSIIRLCYSV